MRWRPLVTQAKNCPSLQPAPCHPLPGTLKQVIASSHREISRKWSNLQLEAFAAECFPQLLCLPQLWDCSAFHEQNATALEKIHVCLFLLEGWARRCSRASLHDSHGQFGHCEDLLGPWVGSETGREKEDKESPGSSAQETTWSVLVDLLIFGVDAVQDESWVFFLYLSVPFCTFLYTD